jgi:hypothetical protein
LNTIVRDEGGILNWAELVDKEAIRRIVVRIQKAARLRGGRYKDKT